MTQDFRYLQAKIGDEGSHYFFTEYSDFEEVEDGKFHDLLEKYREASESLNEYINKKAKDEHEKEYGLR